VARHTLSYTTFSEFLNANMHVLMVYLLSYLINTKNGLTIINYESFHFISLMIPGNFLASCFYFAVCPVYFYIKRQSMKGTAAFILYIQLLKLQFP
jgi:hypothetical protein